uniref:DNA polymerase delta small subunit n=1 Tax=Encephalitozoon cuniculi TaxID=6035 RepID=M1KAT5_ENCCN|nr:DNA polymerase delta small subunit [Encephalitozoon cuniculi]
MDLSSVNYEHQFNRTYDARLMELRPYIIRSAKASGTTPVLDAILDIEMGRGGERCVIVGTLFIASDLKPTIFDRIDRKSKKIKEIEAKTYHTQEVKYFLEDGSGKIELEFLDMKAVYRKHFVISTGMCIGVTGRMAEKGRFLAEDVLFPFSSPRGLPCTPRSQGPSQKLCFVSGLSIGGGNKNRERMMVIADYLRMVGVHEYVIIGCLFGGPREVDRQILSELDGILGYLGTSISLVPNIGDFGSRILPLEPIHPKLFASPVTSHPNPSSLVVDGKRILVTTRFVVEDLLKYLPQDLRDVQGEAFEYKMHLDMAEIGNLVPRNMADEKNIINALSTLVKVGHVCPTAPDTLQSVPFSEKDPFVVTDQTDYFCVGDTDRFLDGQSEDGATLLFTVPRFSRKHEVVILDMEARALDVVRFDMEDFD